MIRSFVRSGALVALVVSSLLSIAPAFAADDAAESAYTDSVRASLNRGKRFPTGREVSIDQPSGRSEITFTLARSGKVTGTKVSQSSNSTPLDNMAKSLVRRAKYPAFPASAWTGESSHAFVVAYNFARTPTGKVTAGEPVEVKAR